MTGRALALRTIRSRAFSVGYPRWRATRSTASRHGSHVDVDVRLISSFISRSLGRRRPFDEGQRLLDHHRQVGRHADVQPLHERAPDRAALLYSYRVCSPIGFGARTPLSSTASALLPKGPSPSRLDPTNCTKQWLSRPYPLPFWIIEKLRHSLSDVLGRVHREFSECGSRRRCSGHPVKKIMLGVIGDLIVHRLDHLSR